MSNQLTELTPCCLCRKMGEKLRLRAVLTIDKNSIYQLCTECYTQYIADMLAAIEGVNTRWHAAIQSAKNLADQIPKNQNKIDEKPMGWIICQPGGVYQLTTADYEFLR